ncbi:MAG TPA: 4Fe-4S dicluster domain-containing protein [Ktedonobacterales bacterium]|nr:4Fe-4S dicluster domain-containing protein [Ktedonobacterales bacterium]
MTKGFFTDTTLCIGCKACEVACKQWNQLPADNYEFTGMSYDNTAALGSTTWRHVAFIEQFGDGAAPHASSHANGATVIAERVSSPASAVAGGFLGENRWLMMSDVCKHCANAGCLNACPTGAIIRNEFGDVYVQPDICNGCGYCQPACPFGVIEVSHEDGRAWKCTLCYDRQKDGLEPACAKACPTQSIQFGELEELQTRARERIGMLHTRGVTDAYLYGVDERTTVGPLNAFFLLVDRPEVYNLPEMPHLPQARVGRSYLVTAVTALAFGAVTALTLLSGRRK